MERESITEFKGRFRIEFSFANDHWLDVKVWLIAASNEDNSPAYYTTNKDGCSEFVDNHADAQTYLQGFVKWDGCCELNADHHHWCALDDIDAHCWLHRYIYAWASQRIAAWYGFIIALPAEPDGLTLVPYEVPT